MRGSSTARALLAGGLTLAVAASLGVAAGCKKEEKKEATSQKPAEGAARGSSSDGGLDRKRQAMGRFQGQGLSARLGLEPITVEEVKPLLPGLKGGTPIGQPVSTARGLRVTAMECLTGEMSEIKTNLEARLKELGFTTVRSSERKTMNIVTVSAEKVPYRLSASVRSGPYPDCPADQKKSKLLMSFFKRPPKPPGTPTGGAATAGGAAAPVGQPPAQGQSTGPGAAAPAPAPQGGSTPAPTEPTK
ncbi:MAG TPA: hypothetical protein VKB80_20750 [Kofleriaceae bacterium]|nr:hypothetical protein [Kofleriaceae bacterium]